MGIMIRQLGLITLVIFGGTFLMRYLRAGEVLADQLTGAGVGLALVVIGTVVQRIQHAKRG